MLGGEPTVHEPVLSPQPNPTARKHPAAPAAANSARTVAIRLPRISFRRAHRLVLNSALRGTEGRIYFTQAIPSQASTDQMQALEQLVDTQIGVLRSNVRLAVVWCFALIAVGVFATAVLYGLSSTSSLPDLTKIGPGLISTAISSLQYKTIAGLRERLSFFAGVKPILADPSLPQSEREKILDLVVDAIKSSTGRW